MLAKFVVTLSLNTHPFEDEERAKLREMALRNLQDALKREEDHLGDHHAPNSPGVTVANVSEYDTDPLFTYWQCPTCKQVDHVQASELDTTGTPHCDSCEEQEMEWITHDQYNKLFTLEGKPDAE